LGRTQSEPIKINFNGISAFVSLIAGRNQVKGCRENGQLLGSPRLSASIRECVSRELTQKKILWRTMLDLFRPGRHAPLQFFEPVQHDIDLRGCCLACLVGLNHQKALAVGRHIEVIGRSRGW
jgi:hypothetical protein